MLGSSCPFVASQRLSSRLEGVKNGLGGGGGTELPFARILLCGTYVSGEYGDLLICARGICVGDACDGLYDWPARDTVGS